MRPTKKTAASALVTLAALFAFSTAAEAAGRYGPTGLGSNLHRRFVLQSAQNRVSQGRPVRGRAIIWQTRPSSSVYRSVSGYRRW